MFLNCFFCFSKSFQLLVWYAVLNVTIFLQENCYFIILICLFLLVFSQLIQHLIDKWRYDHRTLIMDESKYNFNSYTVPPVDSYNGVKPPIYGPSNSIQYDKYYPEPIYIPKPTYTALHPIGKTYIPPPPPSSQNFTDFPGYFNRRPTGYFQENDPRNNLFDYTNKQVNQPYQYQQNYYHRMGDPQSQYNQNQWWRRSFI